MEQQQTIDQAIAKAEFPVKLQGLFKKSRYKVCWGGRGGAKSWGIARALLIKGAKSPIRILCAREYQTSIKDSVHKLLCDQIEALGLLGFYEITQNSIRGRNGTEFAFIGLKNNPTNIKSFEGVDICWVEEAQTVSRFSWNILIRRFGCRSTRNWKPTKPTSGSLSTRPGIAFRSRSIGTTTPGSRKPCAWKRTR
jgi:phage terminase large subunit